VIVEAEVHNEQSPVTGPRDVVGEVIEEEKYGRRIEMVGEILNTELPTIAKRSTAIVMSTGVRDDGTACKLLPPSSNFPDLFDDWVRELSAAPGSHRAENPKNNQPLEVGKLPARPRVKLAEHYEVAGKPWLTTAPKHSKTLMEDTIYSGKGFPSFYVPHDRLVEWENMARENVSVISYTDHFLTSASRLFEMLYDMTDRLEDGDQVDPAFLWNLARQGICMSYSAGMGLKDLVKNSVTMVGETMTTRRDVWLDKMKAKVPATNRDELRFGSLNTPMLFDEEVVLRAKQAARDRRDGITQNKLISEVTKIASHEKTVVAKPVSRFPKQSFGSAGRNYGRGGKSQGYDKPQSHGRSEGDDSYSKPQQKKGQQSSFRGKGQQSRGGYSKKGVQEFGRYN
jgi:hypothetical protein